MAVVDPIAVAVVPDQEAEMVVLGDQVHDRVLVVAIVVVVHLVGPQDLELVVDHSVVVPDYHSESSPDAVVALDLHMEAFPCLVDHYYHVAALKPYHHQAHPGHPFVIGYQVVEEAHLAAPIAAVAVVLLIPSCHVDPVAVPAVAECVVVAVSDLYSL